MNLVRLLKKYFCAKGDLREPQKSSLHKTILAFFVMQWQRHLANTQWVKITKNVSFFILPKFVPTIAEPF